jgi:glycosyltransferase involved in cell wall biosynthesis
VISLIICSRSGDIGSDFRENIDRTIGIDYEIISIDNSKSDHSIFSAYNLGALESKHKYLCFLHDDVLFHSNNWGKQVISVIENENVGLLGIAGAIYKTSVPSPWWISNYNDTSTFIRRRILQHSSKGTYIKTEPETEGNENQLYEVVVVDGVFMCCRKRLWEEIKFDEKFIGFHFYDMDFSMSALKNGYHNYVTHRILLEHFSIGHLDKEWLKSSLEFHKKWKKQLPIGIGQISPVDAQLLKIAALKNILITSNINRGFRMLNWYVFWFQYFRYVPFSKETYSLLWNKIKPTFSTDE